MPNWDWAHAATDGDGTVWVYWTGLLLRIDPTTGGTASWTVRDDPAFASMGFTAGRGTGVWLLDSLGGDIRRFDGESFRDVIPVPPGTTAVTDVVEEADGTLWAATDVGVFAWDGSVWQSTNGGPTWFASAIELDADGRVWVGSISFPGPLDRGVWIYDGEIWTELERPAELPGQVFDIASGPDGRMWLHTEGGISVFDGREWHGHRVSTSGGLIDVGPDGAAWVVGEATAGRASAVGRFDGTNWQPQGPDEGVRAPDGGEFSASAIAATDLGPFVVVGHNVLHLPDGAWHRVWPDDGVPVAPGEPDSMAGVSGDELWATDNGLWHLVGGSWVTGPSDAGLPPGDQIGMATVASDPDGTVWLAGEFGVARRADETWVVVEDRPAKVLAFGQAGEVYLSDGARAWVLRSSGGRWSSTDLPQTPFREISTLAVDAQGTVWAGARLGWFADPAGCVARFVDSEWEVMRPDGDEGVCYAVIGGPSGEIWAIWMRGDNAVLARFEETGWTEFDQEDGLPSIVAFPIPMSIGPDRSVWVGTDEGVARFDGTGWEIVSEGLPTMALSVAPDGAVWVARWGAAERLADP